MPKLKRSQPAAPAEQPPRKAQKTDSMADTSSTRGTEVQSAPVQPDNASSKNLTATTGLVEEVRDEITCKICFQPMFEPFTNPCGHSFCFFCLLTWFQRPSGPDGRGRHFKQCPDCRQTVDAPPYPSYLIKSLTNKLLPHLPHLDGGNTAEEYEKQRQEAASQVAAHKTKEGSTDDGPFSTIFKRLSGAQFKPIHDVEDGVDRCPHCAWEIEEYSGDACLNCGHPIDFDGSMYDSERSGSPYSIPDDSDIDADLEDQDVEDLIMESNPNHPNHLNMNHDWNDQSMVPDFMSARHVAPSAFENPSNLFRPQLNPDNPELGSIMSEEEDDESDIESIYYGGRDRLSTEEISSDTVRDEEEDGYHSDEEDSSMADFIDNDEEERPIGSERSSHEDAARDEESDASSLSSRSSSPPVVTIRPQPIRNSGVRVVVPAHVSSSPTNVDDYQTAHEVSSDEDAPPIVRRANARQNQTQRRNWAPVVIDDSDDE